MLYTLKTVNLSFPLNPCEVSIIEIIIQIEAKYFLVLWH